MDKYQKRLFYAAFIAFVLAQTSFFHQSGFFNSADAGLIFLLAVIDSLVGLAIWVWVKRNKAIIHELLSKE